MNKGIEILLERMKSNPEEFVEQEGYGSKWSGIVAMYKDALDPEDYEAFASARRKLIQDQFTSEVMKELLDPKPSKEYEWVNPQAKSIVSGGQTLGQSSNISGATITVGSAGNGVTITDPLSNHALKIGNQTLDETTLEHMKAHIEHLKKQEQAKHKTLYGRLYNYLHPMAGK